MYHISEDKRARESSAWIYDALERLLGKMPYDKIKITDVCAEAKVGRVTFYRHYDTMDDVLRKKCDEKFAGLLDYIQEYRKTAKHPALFLIPFLRYWYVNPTIIRLLFTANKEFIIAESMDRIVTPAIQQYMPDAFDQSNGYFSAIRFSISVTILREWMKNDMNIPPDDLSSLLLKQMKSALERNILL